MWSRTAPKLALCLSARCAERKVGNCTATICPPVPSWLLLFSFNTCKHLMNTPLQQHLLVAFP